MADDFTDIAMQNSTNFGPGGDDSSEESSEHFDVEQAATVHTVRDQVTSMKFTKYLQQFDDIATTQAVTFGSLPVSGIDDGNRAEALAMGIEKEDEVMQHQNDLDHIDMLQRRRIHEMDQHREKDQQAQSRQLHEIKLKSTVTSELVETYYKHTEQELDIHLTARQAEVLQSVGEIRKFDRGDYDPDKPDWTTFEQQVELRCVRIRGIKNKIPRGEYIMMISKWDKLGGTPIKWSNRSWSSKPPPPCPLHVGGANKTQRRNCEICRGWAGATFPTKHDGGQQDYALELDNRLFTFFPAEKSIKPYMSLIFELIQLPRRRVGKPKVVGWGALPCVDSKFQIVNGKFRFPMMRGAYSPDFAHHKKIQEYLEDDLENWLGNLYIDIFPHPREHYGRGEFHLQTEWANNLLELGHYPSAKDGDGWPIDGRKRGNSFDQNQLKKDGAKATVNFGAVKFDFEEDKEEFPYERPEVIDYEETPSQTFWGIIRKAVMDRALVNKRQADESHRQAVKRAEEQKTFRFSIHPHGAINLESVWRTQVEYCVRGIMDELSLRQPTSGKFWLNVFAMLLAMYFQSFLKALVMYTSLYMMDVPVSLAVPDWAGLYVDYSQLNTTPLQEIFFATWGMFATFFFLLFLIGCGSLIRAFTKRIPDHLSKFVFTIAIGTIMVPWYELIVDVIPPQRRRGDILRLANWFTYHQYGIFFGIIAFLLIYILFIAATGVSIFLYTMRLHLNGILQDAYWRIMLVNEETCTIPDDLEVSMKELKYILEKAERWRGMNYERRKISVTKLITTDVEDPDYQQTNVHIHVKTLAVGHTEDERTDYLNRGVGKTYRTFYVVHNKPANAKKGETDKDTAMIVEVLKKDVPAGMAFALGALKGRKPVKNEIPDGLGAFGGSVNQSVAFF